MSMLDMISSFFCRPRRLLHLERQKHYCQHNKLLMSPDVSTRLSGRFLKTAQPTCLLFQSQIGRCSANS